MKNSTADNAATRPNESAEAYDFIAECSGQGFGYSAKDLAQLELARAIGASVETLREIADARLVSESETITLPARYANCGRHKGWARLAGTRGPSAMWGEMVPGEGYEVGEPGTWIVNSHDGFSREKRTTWKVKHVQVGPQTWTVAS